MSLATQALNPIALDPAFLTCHMATWFWAATEANPPKQILVRAGNIGVIAPSTQQGMLNLPRSGMWDFDRFLDEMPPLGTVLLWPEGVTHSAVVTSKGITGYNQECILPEIGSRGHTHGQSTALQPNKRQCYTIAEATILAEAMSLML